MGLVQLVLDLFAPNPGPVAAPEPPAEAPGAVRRRPIVLSAQALDYVLVRSRRRTIGMLVGPDGIEVRAPRWVSVREIESALQEKADWIVRKLAEAQALQKRRLAHSIEWRDGASFPYLGRPVTIRLGAAPGSGRAPVWHEPEVGPAELCLGLPPQAQEAQVRDAVQAWLMRQARPYFSARLDHFAGLAGVRWTGLGLSGARTRWGSASADGRIRLNWRLMHLRPALIDYVVLHELSHLKVMDHSPSFWDAVGQVMPDYDVRRKELREHALNTDL
jgi:predicted metal-dependent hydrolase